LNVKNVELGCAGIPYKYKAVDLQAQEHHSEGITTSIKLKSI
jgi:hypothetical protein